MGHFKRGFNDLQTRNPELASEWDYKKNAPLTPSDVAAGSHQKVWWTCSECGHSWSAQVYARNNGNGCPVCRYKKSARSTTLTRLKNGNNSLRALAPAFLDEWDYERNQGLTPDDVTPKSAKKVWWKCPKCSSSYYATISGRTADVNGCPVCAGVEVRAGINDLATINPVIAKEWDYDHNDDLLPTQVTANNLRKVSWKCSICGNVWKATIADRNQGTGCPQCKKIFHSSLPEQILFWYISAYFKDSINGYKIYEDGKPYEIDVYIPSLRIGIEYDGERWHRDPEKDRSKNRALSNQNILLIRIREPNLPYISEQCYSILIESIDKNYYYMTPVISELSKYLNANYNTDWHPTPDIEHDLSEIKAFQLSSIKSRSLNEVAPELSLEWDTTENNGLSPDQVSAHCDFKAAWICKKCGHKWKASVGDRVSGHGCPYCAGRAVRTGYNDLATMRPDLLSDWNYEKNTKISPDSVAYRSEKKVWWHCQKCGQDFQQRIADRSQGVGCPVCSGKVIVAGINDLATDNAELALEWDYEKNGDLSPDSLAPQSNKKVWWKCRKCGHSWCAAVYSRNGNGRGCPVCSRKRKVKA